MPTTKGRAANGNRAERKLSAEMKGLMSSVWRGMKTVGRGIAALTALELVGCAIGLLLLVLAVIGPIIAPYPTETAFPYARLLSPGGEHWLGTDENGMDILSRILAAPRSDVEVAIVATGISLGIGAPVGVLVGFFEGTARRGASFLVEVVLRLLDVIQAFPVFILALVLVAVRGTSLTNIIGAIAFVNMPVFLRLARAEVLSLRERPYAEAARAVGNSDMRIAFRHLLPNAFPPLIVQLSVTIGFAILLTASLSFVGAGVTPPTPELGAMIAGGAKFLILGQWWPALFPGIALGVTVFAFGIGGEALGRFLDPSRLRPGASAMIPVDESEGTQPTLVSLQ
jgi:peptide/nickel transport system permease protein